MIRIYRDVDTNGVLNTIQTIEREIGLMSPIMISLFDALKGSVKNLNLKEAIKLTKLISVAGKAGNVDKIKKTKLLARALEDRLRKHKQTKTVENKKEYFSEIRKIVNRLEKIINGIGGQSELIQYLDSLIGQYNFTKDYDGIRSVTSRVKNNSEVIKYLLSEILEIVDRQRAKSKHRDASDHKRITKLVDISIYETELLELLNDLKLNTAKQDGDRIYHIVKEMIELQNRIIKNVDASFRAVEFYEFGQENINENQKGLKGNEDELTKEDIDLILKDAIANYEKTLRKELFVLTRRLLKNAHLSEATQYQQFAINQIYKDKVDVSSDDFRGYLNAIELIKPFVEKYGDDEDKRLLLDARKNANNLFKRVQEILKVEKTKEKTKRLF